MSNAASQSVVLNDVTFVSLNDRFTSMLKSKRPTAVSAPASKKQQQQQQQWVDVCNSRLVQELASRPSVQAALSHKQSLKQQQQQQQQQLGDVQARLGWPVRARTGGGAAGGRGGKRGPGGEAARGRGRRMRGALSLRGRRAFGGGGYMQDLRRRGRNRAAALGRGGAGRGGGGGAPGRGGAARGRNGRGGYSGRQGGGQGRARGAGRPAVTRDQLDDQLDAYMSKSKAHLDADLDTYMTQEDSDSTE